MKSTTSLGLNWFATASIVGENGPMMKSGWLNSNLRNAGKASTESAASSTYLATSLCPRTPPALFTS